MNRSRQRWCLPVLALFAAVCGSAGVGAEEPGRSPREWLEEFSREWQEDDWTVSFRLVPDGYMRPRDDADWKTRMLALQAFVKHGKDAVPVLLDALKNGDDPQRILAAQALGYLAPHVPHEPLLHAAQSDKNPAVRLYAVDSLGMQGGTEKIGWDTLRKAETNRDVQKHIGYAMERQGRPAESEVINRLAAWDAKTIDSARLDQPAPDFELTAATGETVRLSDFRGKKAVVLVFIYGDT